jgi:hypothetical protein
MVTSPLNPYYMTNALGTFNVTSDGYIQGMALDQPAVRYALSGGVLISSATVPMWGGVAISENIAPTAGFDISMGGTIMQATQVPTSGSGGSTGDITGFSVFDQNHAMLNSPATPVPLAYSGMPVLFYRLGSGARIPVACDPALGSLEGSVTTTQVSWNFADQTLQPYDASTSTYAITSNTWANTNGGQGTVVMSAALPFTPVAGSVINISGATNTGTGGNSAVNGTFYVVSATNTSNFVLAMPAASGVIGTIAGSPVVNMGTARLPVRVLKIQVGNSMTVEYNAATSSAFWNRSGTTALILI